MDIKEKIEKLKTEKMQLTNRSGQQLEVPKEGSLGIFALGYKGIMAWKRVTNQKSDKK
jgi:hypothetical protein